MSRSPRKLLRIALTALAALPVTVIASVFQQNVQSFATARHWDNLLATRAPQVMTDVAYIGQFHGFWMVAGFVIGAACASWLIHFLPHRPEFTKEVTYCKLNIPSISDVTVTEHSNINRWFLLRVAMAVPFLENGQLKAAENHAAILFIIYDKPVSDKQFRISIAGIAPPRWEVKERSQWGCVIAFNNSLAGAVLEVRIEPQV